MARTVPCVLDRISGPNLRCTTLCLPFSIGTLALGLERCRVVSVAPQLQNTELQFGCRKDLHIQALKLPSAQACGQITTAPRCYEDRHAQVDRWHRQQLIRYSVIVARAAWPFTERRSCRQFIDAFATWSWFDPVSVPSFCWKCEGAGSREVGARSVL
jgi:hypothetical protein